MDIRSFFGKKRGLSSSAEPKESDSVTQNVSKKAKQSEYEKTKRERTVKEEWLTLYPWAKHEKGELFCETCRKYPNIADTKSSVFKGITEKFKKETLKWHDNSSAHKTCVYRDLASSKPEETEYGQCMKKLDDKNAEKYKLLFNTAYFVALEGDAFTKFPKLCELQNVNGIDIGQNYTNNVACREIVNSIAESISETTKSEINKARFVSVLSDGSTDKAIVEQEAVFVRYLVDGTPVTRLADFVPLKSGDARGVKDGIFDGLASVGLNKSNIANKCVGINTDGAAVNLGKKSGAVKQMIDDIQNELGEDSTTEHIAIIHCVAHNLELAILDAKKESTYLKRFEEIVKGVFNLYYYSPKRRRHLKEIAENLDRDLRHFGGIKQIRWLSSQLRALEAIKVNWEITVIHLGDIASGKDETAARASGLLKDFKTIKFVSYLNFMMDFLGILGNVSRSFQLEDCLVSEICQNIEIASQKLIKLKEKPGKHMKTFLAEYNEETKEYRDVKLTQPPSQRRGKTDSQEPDIHVLQDEKYTLIDNTNKYLQNRFLIHFNDENTPHALFKVFDYKLWPSEVDRLRSYGDEKVEKLVGVYTPVLTEEEIENASEEWLDLKMYVNQAREINPITLYGNLLNTRPENMKHILPLVEVMMCISPSTAACERSFSLMNNVKTELRTCLSQGSLSSLIRIAAKGTPLKEFEPMAAIECWLKKRNRHVGGHKLPGPRVKPPIGGDESSSDSE